MTDAAACAATRCPRSGRAGLWLGNWTWEGVPEEGDFYRSRTARDCLHLVEGYKVVVAGKIIALSSAFFFTVITSAAACGV